MKEGFYKDGRRVKVYLHEYCDIRDPNEFEIIFEDGSRIFEPDEKNITYGH